MIYQGNVQFQLKLIEFRSLILRQAILGTLLLELLRPVFELMLLARSMIG